MLKIKDNIDLKDKKVVKNYTNVDYIMNGY